MTLRMDPETAAALAALFADRSDAAPAVEAWPSRAIAVPLGTTMPTLETTTNSAGSTPVRPTTCVETTTSSATPPSALVVSPVASTRVGVMRRSSRLLICAAVTMPSALQAKTALNSAADSP